MRRPPFGGSGVSRDLSPASPSRILVGAAEATTLFASQWKDRGLCRSHQAERRRRQRVDGKAVARRIA
jgi:hypothetical protein